jgi:hypothetical protein
MTAKKRLASRPAHGRDVAVVQILRQGQWSDVDWVHTGNKCKYSTTILSEELGAVTGVRVKYLPNDSKDEHKEPMSDAPGKSLG